jgi:transcriptional regulator with XRE-family HTH domain
MADIAEANRLRLGKRIQQLRLLKNLSQEQLAERVGNGWRNISQIERGQTNVGIDVLSHIAKQLSVELVDLFEGSSRRSPDFYTVDRRGMDALERALKVVQATRRVRRPRRKKSE